MNGIGALNENPLHAALKLAAAPPGAAFEVPLDGFVIDAIADGLLIEVQTRNVGQMRRKLQRLLEAGHRVRLVLPVSAVKWIVKEAAAGAEGSGSTRRRSPKRGHLADAARELASIPELIDHPGLELELLLIEEEERREHREGVAWRRRGWVTIDRRLLGIVERRRLQGRAGVLGLLPEGLVEPFGSAEVAALSRMPRRSAQALLYCLRRLGAIVASERLGRAQGYRFSAPLDRH